MSDLESRPQPHLHSFGEVKNAKSMIGTAVTRRLLDGARDNTSQPPYFLSQVIIMKLEILISGMLVLCCTAASAQDTNDRQTAVYPTDEGKLVVHTGQPAAQDPGPAPTFAQLDRRGAGYLNSDDAAGYALLANDFIYADSNRDGRISKAEYNRWVRAR
ncbi:MAG: hypothetical protein ABIQ70_14475 [Dokdonella sp.]